MSEPNNFITNSDYDIDMVAKIISGSFKYEGDPNSAYNPIKNQIIKHNLNFTPLVSGFWSINPNFSPAYPFGYVNRLLNGSIVFGIYGIGANSENIYIRADASKSTYYYKIYCLVQNELTSKVAPAELSNFKKFIFNSDLNYLKIAKCGIVNLPAYGTDPRTGTDPGTRAWTHINHNLGYVPFTKFWYCQRGTGFSLDNIFWINSAYPVEAKLDQNRLSLVNNDYTGTADVIYRIYTDEA